MGTVLAVDIGRTGCRVAWWGAGATGPMATATGEGSLGLGAREGVAAAESAILSVARPLLEARRVKRVDRVGVGIAGALTAPPGVVRQLAERLAESLPARRVSVASDAITSHAGALGGKPGVVLAAGTGVVAVAIGGDRRLQRVDGWGPWLGDEGSGAWIGHCGLQAVARARDGRGAATALSAAAEEQFGPLDRLAARLGSEHNPARCLAAFAPAVAAAARDGDPVSTDLMHAAASALAATVIAAAKSLHGGAPVPAAIIGGLTNLGPVLLDPLRAALASSPTPISLQSAVGTSLDGARLVATLDEGIHDLWVVRAIHAGGTTAGPYPD